MSDLTERLNLQVCGFDVIADRDLMKEASNEIMRLRQLVTDLKTQLEEVRWAAAEREEDLDE